MPEKPSFFFIMPINALFKEVVKSITVLQWLEQLTQFGSDYLEGDQNSPNEEGEAMGAQSTTL